MREIRLNEVQHGRFPQRRRRVRLLTGRRSSCQCKNTRSDDGPDAKAGEIEGGKCPLH